jgi:chromosome segregation ATPase
LRQRAEFLSKDLAEERASKERFKQLAIERGRSRKDQETRAGALESATVSAQRALEDENRRLERDIDRARSQEQVARTALESMESSVRESGRFQRERDDALTKQRDLEGQLAAVNERLRSIESARPPQALQDRVDELEEEVGALTTRLTTFSSTIRNLEEELAKRNKIIARHEDARTERARAQKEQSELLASLSQEYNSLRERS